MINTKAQEMQPPMASVPPPEYSVIPPSPPEPQPQAQIRPTPPAEPQLQPPTQPQTRLAAAAQLGEQYRSARKRISLWPTSDRDLAQPSMDTEEVCTRCGNKL
ncbi:hypothetical protein C0992_003779 [Termitomyces sp. T32_za158]|nr:hypothetical protein C0992_003779 [Termitomyces sp. T32_za158]